MYLHACQVRVTVGLFLLKTKDIHLVEFMYRVFTRMPGESYCRRLEALLLYLCYVFRALIKLSCVLIFIFILFFLCCCFSFRETTVSNKREVFFCTRVFSVQKEISGHE